MNINELYHKLLQEVHEDDLHSQRYYLSMVEDHRKIPVDYLLSIGALFIPNNGYIKHYLGEHANDFNAGLYYDNVCAWSLFVIIPIRNLIGDVVGLVGWDAQNKYLEVSEGTVGLAMYKVSPKSIFPREKHFLSDPTVLKDNFSKDTIFVTDGVFDSIALNYRNIPTIALLGSTLSKETMYFLRWFGRVFVVKDNDTAGNRLFGKMKKALPNVYAVIQDKTKDIEELLRCDGVDGIITTQLRSVLDSEEQGDVVLRTSSFRGRRYDSSKLRELQLERDATQTGNGLVVSPGIP